MHVLTAAYLWQRASCIRLHIPPPLYTQMEAPKTPSKTRDDGINSIVKTLCAKWGLKLPIRDTPWSPSKIPHPGAVEEKVLGKIRFLYFKDRDALDGAIKQFEEHAHYIYSKWKFKPRAELDVLPSLAPSESALRRDSARRRDDVTVSEGVTAELAENLLHCLDQAAELVRLRVEFEKVGKADQLGSPDVFFTRLMFSQLLLRIS